MSDVYITANELINIADACSKIDGLWDVLVSHGNGLVGYDLVFDFKVVVRDANRESLGFISFGDSGAVFYPDGNDD